MRLLIRPICPIAVPLILISMGRNQSSDFISEFDHPSHCPIDSYSKLLKKIKKYKRVEGGFNGTNGTEFLNAYKNHRLNAVPFDLISMGRIGSGVKQ